MPDNWPDKFPVSHVEKHGSVWVVRDDVHPGGTKQIVLQHWLPQRGATHFVYTASAFGKGGPALAYACAALGYRATLFLAEGPHAPLWLDAVRQTGADIIVNPPMPVKHLECLAHQYAGEQGADYVPLGFADDAFIAMMAEYARGLSMDVPEIWCPLISGTMLRALETVFPNARAHGVAVVKHHDYTGAATIHHAPEKFVRGAAIPPPYPSWTYSDAKIWRFVKKHATAGAVIWNSNA